jgi:hypothetical protein
MSFKCCYVCNKFVGLDDFGIWHSYRPTCILYNDNNEDDYLVDYDYICISCHPCLYPSWKCHYCLKTINNTEIYCDSIVKGNKTCLDCLKKYKEENEKDLSCNCNICREINNSFNFQPK